MSGVSYSYDFRIVSYPTRVYSGLDALDQLPSELGRHRAKRAFVVCGRSVSQKTNLITRIRALLGDLARRRLRRDGQGLRRSPTCLRRATRRGLRKRIC